MHLFAPLTRRISVPLTLAVPWRSPHVPARTFPFPWQHRDAAEWFSVYFEQQILVRHSPEGFPATTSPTVNNYFQLPRCNVYASGFLG